MCLQILPNRTFCRKCGKHRDHHKDITLKFIKLNGNIVSIHSENDISYHILYILYFHQDCF